jgi:signal transduction histidine kinase
MPLVTTSRAAPSRERLIRTSLVEGSLGLVLVIVVTLLRAGEIPGIIEALGPGAWLLVFLLYLFATALAMLRFHLTDEIFVSLSVTAFIASFPLLGIVIASWLTLLSSMTARALSMSGIGPTPMSMDDPVKERVRLFGLFSTYGIPVVVASLTYEAVGGTVPLRDPSLQSALQMAAGAAAFILTNIAVMKPVQRALGYQLRDSYKLDVADAAIYVAAFPYSVMIPFAWVGLGFRGVVPLLYTGLIGTWMIRKFADARSKNAKLIQRLSSLANIAAAVSISSSRQDLLRAIYTECSKVMDVSLFTIAIYDADKSELRFELDVLNGEFVSGAVVPVGEGLNSWVVRNRMPLVIASNREEARQGLQHIDDGLPTESWLGVPMIVQERVIGVLSVQSFRKAAFSEDDLVLLKAVASQAAAAIEDSVLYHGLESRVVERTNELHETNLRLQATDRAKTQFLANMSHELRTPLNSIIGFSTILRERTGGTLAPRFRTFLENIHTSGTHLLSLINDILDLAKVESGRFELEFEKFDIRETIGSVERVIRGVAADTEVVVQTTVDPSLGEVTMDEGRFKQILLNLLSNAVKFSPRGAWVRLSVHRLEPEVSPLGCESIRVVVADQGSGIPPEDLPKIYDEFYQVSRRQGQSKSGTGLGLPLTQRFVAAHGGKISVDSTLAKGTSFTVDLPLRADEVCAAADEAVQSRTSAD